MRALQRVVAGGDLRAVGPASVMVIASSFQRLAHLSHERRGREWLLEEREATIDPRSRLSGVVSDVGARIHPWTN
jgi:hypothetical protein